MFRSRKSSQSNAAARNTPATAAAASAAAQAFLANRASNANLSSSAAAAALRTHATSPAPVSEVQTKRMQRRGSVSSNGSGAGGPGALRRQGSSGSMTERTFRDQSPSRPSSSRAEEPPPPIPALPKNYAKRASKNKLVRRPSSAEPQQRIMSPVPDAPGGRGVSLDRSGSIPKSDPPPLPSTPRLAKIDTGNGVQKGTRQASVNFSRPMSPQAPSPSPTSSSRPTSQPKTQSQRQDDIISPSDVQNIDHSLQNAATAPVKKRKKKSVPSVAEGSHLKVGHLAGKISGTAVEVEAPDQKVPVKSTTADEKRSVADRIQPRVATAAQSDDSSDVDVSDGSPSSQGSKGGGARAAKTITKQPSIVREDPEGEEIEERKAEVEAGAGARAGAEDQAITAARVDEAAEEPKEVKDQQSEANGTVPLPDPVSTSKSRSQHINGNITKAEGQATASPSLQPKELPKEQKRLSLSPSRQAHFSAQPIMGVPGLIKHEPPARAASPAKSALKRSPSPRHPSPSGLALSEVSDSMSLGSEDGIRPGKKKRNVRVSFDDEPLVVGEAADPQSNTNSPIVFSPQSRDPLKRPIFSFRRDKLEEAPQDDKISPVPKLPSFGSVRGRKEREVDGDTGASSKLFSGEGSSQNELGSSSDHAVGAVIAQAAASKVADHLGRDPNEPLPPEVTTVEGSGYHSDSESSDSGAIGNIAVKSTEFPEEPTQKPVEVQAQDLPTIAVQPATPGQESIRGDRESWLGNMPGSFPTVEFTLPEPEPPGASETLAESVKASKSLESKSIADEETKAPSVGERSEFVQEPVPKSDDESDDSGNSIYSDAAEDVADLEGDGFGSINAIVDSPVIAPSTQILAKTTEMLSLETSPSTATTADQNDQSWESTKSFWSGVNEGNKSETNDEQTTQPSTITSSSSSIRPQNGQPKERKGVDPATRQREALQEISPPPKSKLRDIPETPPMRKSMRSPRPSSQVESAVPLRYPMIEKPQQRNEPPRLAKTLRQGPKAPAPQPSDAPQALREPVKKRLSTQKPTPKTRQGTDVATTGNASVSSKTLAPITEGKPSRAAKSTPKPLLPLVNDSDSDSSFKRARRRPANGSSRYTMRRSMRAAAPEGRPQSASFSSTSTTGAPPALTTRQRPMSATGMSLRTSLRDSNPGTRAAPQTPPTRQFGFGKGNKNTNKSRFRSRRLSNSSNEDDEPKTFRSRFADSSDEDEPAAPKLPLGLAPVRGIPKRIDEGDSTDLEDSDEEAKQRSNSKPALSSPPLSVSLNDAAKNEGSALASGSLRHKAEEPVQPATRFGALASFRKAEPEKRRSLFGALGRKKDKSKFKPDIESAARRDTPLERTKQERTIVGLSPDSPTGAAAARPMSPTAPPSRGKLQRRVTPQRVFSDSWPLPPPIPESPTSPKSDQRPATADGASPARPSAGPRKISTNTNQGDGVAVGRTGKKKRFPMLRKAFGLHD